MAVAAVRRARNQPRNNPVQNRSSSAPVPVHWGFECQLYISEQKHEKLSAMTPTGHEDNQARELAKVEHSLITIRNVTRDTVIAERVEIAGSNAKRSKGLLGRKGIAAGGGLWIVPCEAVHTFFMQFPIDLIYLDKKLRVKKVRTDVKAWRVSACLVAHSVLELPTGTIQKTGTNPGDVLELQKLVCSAGAQGEVRLHVRENQT